MTRIPPDLTKIHSRGQTRAFPVIFEPEKFLPTLKRNVKPNISERVDPSNRSLAFTCLLPSEILLNNYQIITNSVAFQNFRAYHLQSITNRTSSFRLDIYHKCNFTFLNLFTGINSLSSLYALKKKTSSQFPYQMANRGIYKSNPSRKSQRQCNS